MTSGDSCPGGGFVSDLDSYRFWSHALQNKLVLFVMGDERSEGGITLITASRFPVDT